MIFETVVLNLDSRPDRLIEVSAELEKQGLPFTRFKAIKNDDGQKGYNASIKAIFEQYKDIENLLIIEDDCYFEGEFDQSVFDELPRDYDGFWLGSNLQSDHRSHFNSRISILENGWNTHATMFSKRFRDWALKECDWTIVFDEWVRIRLRSRKCYVLRPMIAFQRPSNSDIINGYADYTEAWQNAKARLL